MKKIALITPETFCEYNSSDLSLLVENHARSLSASEYEIFIYSPAAENLPEYEELNFAKVQRVPFCRDESFIKSSENLCRAFVDYVFYHEDNYGSFEKIHIFDWPTINTGLWLKKGRGREFYLTLTSIEAGRFTGTEKSIESIYIEELEKAGITESAATITVSENLQQNIIRNYNLTSSSIKIVTPCIDLPPIDNPEDNYKLKSIYGIKPGSFVLFSFFNLESRTGTDLLINSAQLLLKEDIDFTFIVSGDGPLKNEYQDTINKMNLNNYFIFTGIVRNKERKSLINAADSIIIPTRNFPFSMLMLEAWSLCKPVISTRNSNPGDFIWHEVNGLHIKCDPTNIKEAVCRLNSDLDFCSWMGRNGRVAVETAFNSEIYRRNILKIIEKL